MRYRQYLLIIPIFLAAVVVIFSAVNALNHAPVPQPEPTNAINVINETPTAEPEPIVTEEPAPLPTETVTPVVAPTPEPVITPTPTPTPGPVTNLTTPAAVSLSDYQSAIKAATKVTAIPMNLTPDAMSAATPSRAYTDGCAQSASAPVSNISGCVYGDSTGKNTIWLIGDEHAAQWFPALDAAAKQLGAQLVVHTKDSCPVTSGTPYSNALGRKFTECATMNSWWLKNISKVKPSLVLMSSSHSAVATGLDAAMEGINAYAGVAKVAILGDTPNFKKDVPSCLSGSATLTSCSISTSKGLNAPVIATLQDLASSNGYRYIDASKWMCSSATCPTVVGNTLLYHGNGLLTDAGAAWLRNILQASLAKIL